MMYRFDLLCTLAAQDISNRRFAIARRNCVWHWRRLATESLRWHSPVFALGTLAFWIALRLRSSDWMRIHTSLRAVTVGFGPKTDYATRSAARATAIIPFGAHNLMGPLL